MKSIRKFVLAGTVALLTLAASTPAHATLSGSNPRPPQASISIYLSAILAVFGY
jgi:hypothetical protein